MAFQTDVTTIASAIEVYNPCIAREFSVWKYRRPKQVVCNVGSCNLPCV